MNNPFFIERSYRIRHQILGFLHTDKKSHNNEERIVGSAKIAEETNIPIKDIHHYQHLLVQQEEILVSYNDGQFMMSILPKGTGSFVDNRYLKEGRKAKWDGIFDWARILIPLGALILSVYNTYYNNRLSSKIKELETKVQQFKK